MKSVNLKIIYLIAQVIPSIVFHYHKEMNISSINMNIHQKSRIKISV